MLFVDIFMFLKSFGIFVVILCLFFCHFVSLWACFLLYSFCVFFMVIVYLTRDPLSLWACAWYALSVTHSWLVSAVRP